MQTKTIRRHADVEELVKNIAPTTGADFATGLLQEAIEAQEALVAKIHGVLSSLDEFAPNVFEMEIMKARASVSEVTTKLSGLLQHHDFDPESTALCRLEQLRWGTLEKLFQALMYYTQNKMPLPAAVNWLDDVSEDVTKLQADHARAYAAAERNKNKTVKVVPNRPKPKEAATNQDDDEPYLPPIFTNKDFPPEPKPKPDKQLQKAKAPVVPDALLPDLRALLSNLLRAGELIATATAKKSNQYGEAKQLVDKSKPVVAKLAKSLAPPTTAPAVKEEKPKVSTDEKATQHNGRYIKFAGCLYKAVD